MFTLLIHTDRGPTDRGRTSCQVIFDNTSPFLVPPAIFPALSYIYLASPAGQEVSLRALFHLEKSYCNDLQRLIRI